MSKLLLSLCVCAGVAACSKPAADVFPGYVEGDNVRLSAPVSGILTKLYVQRGDSVAANAPAFVLEQESERSSREEAEAGVQRAQDQVANLKLGKRPEEIAALRAQQSEAQAALNLSSAELVRARKLVAENFNSPASLDQASAAVARDQARVNELVAQMRLAMQGSRSNEIAAAEQAVKAAKAQLAQADWRVQQKTQRIPVAGDVVDVMYREGEWVPQGGAVLSLLPPSQVKARFFLPQPMLGKVVLGQSVQLQCDGCPAPITAKVSFIAREAEFTSPIIYSKENRAALVFMVEARTTAEDARHLHPGQPLEVRL
ncbi:MAG: HlyD family efflux transporter periplasmic adaptor subunit [Rhizobacter sp.]